MNQSSSEAPDMNLQPPAGEQLPTKNAGPELSVQPAEQAPASPELAPQTAAPPPLPVPANPQSMATAAAGNDNQTDVSTTTQVKTSKIIEDTDLIEKEWVDKAKRIVERNRDDPYKQSEEITGVRAEYMKKQYNKTIKLDK
jgi:hypothetical protein